MVITDKSALWAGPRNFPFPCLFEPCREHDGRTTEEVRGSVRRGRRGVTNGGPDDKNNPAKVGVTGA